MQTSQILLILFLSISSFDLIKCDSFAEFVQLFNSKSKAAQNGYSEEEFSIKFEPGLSKKN